ncbi:MAG: hypothetical protein Q8P67_22270 [archaeon]|nr:hypothetical protein [archaeon]
MSGKPVTPIDVLPREHQRRARVPFDTRTYAPNMLPSGLVLFLGGALVIAGGIAVLGRSNRKRRAAERELREIRQDVAPLLQYEQDRQLHEYMWIRRLYEDTYIHEYQLKHPHGSPDVHGVSYAPGWSPVTDPVYNTRFIPPMDVSLQHH